MLDILHRMIEPSLVASIEIESRNGFWKEIDGLGSACVNCICDPLFLMYDMHDSTGKKELCYPVTRQINDDSVDTKIIGRCEIYSTFHFGSHGELDNVIHSFLSSLHDSIDRLDILIKEIYHEFYLEKEEENVTEIQLLIPLERE